MPHIYCFGPLITANSKLLILGTIPGVESQRRAMYYANSNNHFWDIVFRCLQKDWNPYKIVSEEQTKEQRYSLLLENRIGLWDMISECDREGSNDSKILNPKYNDLTKFLGDYSVDTILFNGMKAYDHFKKSNKAISDKIKLKTLNSTSSLNPNFHILIEWRDFLLGL